jgi:hypothetical protein
MKRPITSRILAAVTLVLLTPVFAQSTEAKICRKGIPCGDTCISAQRVCHVGRGSAIHVSETQTTEPYSVPPAFDPVTENEKIFEQIVSATNWRSCFKNMASGQFAVQLAIGSGGDLRELANVSELSRDSILCLREALGKTAFAVNSEETDYSYVQSFRK